VIRQVLQAVDRMHRQGLVHRDIKLENIVYESRDRERVKLIDFGFCTVWEEHMPPMSRYCGTERYMAPEVHEMSYTSKVDLWCLGVAAHQLLTGEMFCSRSDRTPTFSKRFEGLSTEAKNFVAALLSVDPASRMSASQALRHCWMHDAQRQAPLAKGKKSLWQCLPSLRATEPRAKAASRVAPEVEAQRPGAASSGAWYGLLPPTSTGVSPGTGVHSS